MASYGNTVLTSAGIDLVKRVIANTATFEITKVATSSDSRLTNATISTIEALTAMSSVQQTGKVTAFDTSNSKQVGLKCEFTNQGLTNQYDICGVGIYAAEAGKKEILFAVAPAKEPETMPAKPDDQSALFTFSLNMYVAVGQASAMSITATTEGVVKSINGTIKPDANGNVTLSYYSRAEVDQKVSSLSATVSNLHSGDRNYARYTSNEWQTLTGFTGATNYCTYNLGVFYLDDLKAGDTFTIGYTIKNSGIQSGNFQLQGIGNSTLWNYMINGTWYDIAKVCPDGATTTLIDHYTLTAGNLKNSSFNLRIRTENFPAGTLSYRRLFVKKGTMATDWTPAPEDLEDDITSTKTIANAAKEKADANANSIKSLSDETTRAISSLKSTKANNTDFDALKIRVAATESGKADKASVYDKETADGRYLQRDASTTLKSGSVLRWDDSGHANDGSNVPFTAGGLHWSGKTDSAEIRAEETGPDNLDLVFNLGDDGSNSVDFRWNNVSKAKINSSGKFTGHVDWANVDDKDTYSRAEIDSLNSTKASSADLEAVKNRVSATESSLAATKSAVSSVKATADSLTTSMANAQGDISALQQRADSITSTLRSGGVNLLNNSQGNFHPKNGIIDNFEEFDGVNVYMTQGQKYTVSAQAAPGFVFSGTHDNTKESNRIVLWLVDPPNNVWQIISSDTTDPSMGGTHFTWDNPSGMYTLRVNSYKRDNSGYAHHVQIEYGDIATPWKPSNGDIASTTTIANAAKEKADANANSIKSLSDETTKAISNLNSKMPQAAYVPIQIGDKTDLNDMKTCGFYLLQGETSNSPVDGWAYVKVQGIPTRLNQFAWQDINPAEQWCRWYDGSKWLPWVHCTKATEPIRLGGYRPKPGAVPFVQQ